MNRKLYGSPDPFDLFTKGKKPELTIAFNLAYDNIEKYINTLQPLKDPLSNTDQLQDKTYAYLRQYLWKGNAENKNTAGYELREEERRIITKLLDKLRQVRNFYSHAWHENSMMAFDPELQYFIQDRHVRACAKLMEEKTADASLYFEQQADFPLFKERKFITQDGRVFFLSLFLSKGEMQGLLQKMKGYKRNNMPSYQFKQKVYTFYCHREGSSWDNTGIDNAALEQRENEEQDRILHGRQASRIFSYLKDLPVFTREEALPLMLSSGRQVENMDGLLQFMWEKNILHEFSFYKKWENPEDHDYLDERERNEENKRLEKKEREGYRTFSMPGNNTYAFEIGYPALKHIVTDIFLDAHESDPQLINSSRDHFLGVLKDSLETRKYIYEALKKEGDHALNADTFLVKKKYSSIYIDYEAHKDSIQELYYSVNEWRNIPISATPRVEKLLIEWHSAFMLGKPGEVNNRKKLLNTIRPLDEPFDISLYQGLLKTGRKKVIPATEPEPLLFHLAYYYREQDMKQRKEDRFLEWGMRYLMDMGLVPDWHFEMEQLKYERKSDHENGPYKLKKETVWEKYIPDNYRLRITDNQVNVGIDHGGRIYRLRIGEKILKYLLHWHFRENKKEGKTINGFLQHVTSDLAIVHNNKPGQGDLASLQLLEEFSIPPLLYKTKLSSENVKEKKTLLYKEQVLKYLSGKLQWVDDQLKDIRLLNRNQKNFVLLNAYRLFDFTETEGSKFLRKNEYEQMSICHYMLYREKGKVKGLLERTFKLKKRLPEEILDLFYSVISTQQGNLDDLLLKVLRNRRRFLKVKIDLVGQPGIKARQIRQDVVAGMDIYMEDSQLWPEELQIRNEARLETLENLPFAVHPALTLKYLYPDRFAAQGFRKEGGDYTNLFLSLRKDVRLSGFLSGGPLREGAAAKILNSYMSQFSGNEQLTRFSRKWIGTMNELKTRNILLLLVAEDYLEKYDPATAEEFKKIKNLKKLRLDELFHSGVPTILFIDQGLRNELEGEYNKTIPLGIHLLLRMHQLDDYFFRSQKEKLVRLAIFFLNWRQEELEIYKDYPEIADKIRAWPDGSAENPLTMGQLVEARKVNAGYAVELMGHIFNYENMVLNHHTNTDDKVKMQQFLVNASMAAGKNNLYVDFTTILSWDQDTPAALKDKIRQLRNACLHSAIPLNGSYRLHSIPGTAIADTLFVNTRLGNDRTIPNIYELAYKSESAEV